MSWTEEQVEQLRKLHGEGVSFALISEAIGHTRNSCIGKARRLDLPMRVTVKSKNGEPKPKGQKRRYFSIVRANGKNNNLRVLETVQADLPEFSCDVVPLNKPFADIAPGECRYIMNDPRDGAICCGHQIHKHSFCRAHFERCYVEPAKRWAGPGTNGYRASASGLTNNLESAA
jgi:hypothetical protein